MDLHNSSTTVVKFKKELGNDKILSNYFENIRKSLNILAGIGNFSNMDMGKLIGYRSYEMCVLDAYIELFPFNDPDNGIMFIDMSESMLRNHAKFLISRCFHSKTPDDECLQYSDRMSINLLQLWDLWQKKLKANSKKCSDPVTNLVLVSCFMIQLYVSILKRNTNRLWWLIGLSEHFFDCLLKSNVKGLIHLINDLLAGHPPIVCCVIHLIIHFFLGPPRRSK